MPMSEITQCFRSEWPAHPGEQIELQHYCGTAHLAGRVTTDHETIYYVSPRQHSPLHPISEAIDMWRANLVRNAIPQAVTETQLKEDGVLRYGHSIFVDPDNMNRGLRIFALPYQALADLIYEYQEGKTNERVEPHPELDRLSEELSAADWEQIHKEGIDKFIRAKRREYFKTLPGETFISDTHPTP